jgi:hypothetical protein
VIRLYHLEVHDLTVTKLKRFSLKDQEDIQGICDLGVLDPGTLQERVEAAYWLTHEKDGDPGREAAFASLRVVKRYLSEGIWKLSKD